MIQKSYRLLDRFLTSRIVYNILNEEAWAEYINQDDPVIKSALEVMRKKEAFPKKPQAKKGKKVAVANKKSWKKNRV